MGSKRCIISLATANKRYRQGLARLLESARRCGYDGERRAWEPGTFPAGCPSHRQVPFAFKPYCFREARAQGMDLVLWLDSACVVVRTLDPLFRQIEERGYLLFGNGEHKVGEWASDAALARLDLGREEAMGIREVNAAAIGLNLADGLGGEFLERWYDEAREGTAFRGVASQSDDARDAWKVKWNRGGRASADPRVRGHRHDQTVAGVLAHRLGMELTATGIESSAPESARDERTVIVIDRKFVRDPIENTPLGRARAYLRRRFGALRQRGRGRPLPSSR